ncbi:MAG TPA: hypothetical protein VFW76_02650 [Ktedonobacterales bacterium]|nr:hypothetical protein [Ktedonobacterales bacterium]
MSQNAPSHSAIEEVAEFFGRGPSRDEIRQFQLSDETQAWISELLDKEDEGTLSAEERHQLDELLIIHDVVTLIRSQVQLAGS